MRSPWERCTIGAGGPGWSGRRERIARIIETGHPFLLDAEVAVRPWSCRWLAALTLSCCALASAAAAQPCPDLPFRPNVPVPGLTSPVRFAIADFNEDGHRDL